MSIKIELKSLHEEKGLQIKINPELQIYDIKKELININGEVTYIHLGRILDQNKKISDYGIKDGDYIVYRDSGNGLLVYYKKDSLGREIKNIKWNNNRDGLMTYQNGSGPCYNPKYAIQLALLQVIKIIIINGDILREMSENTKYSLNGCYLDSLTKAYPPFYDLSIHKIRNKISDDISKLLLKYISNKDNKVNDIKFLVLLGRQRDWKECALCLEDENMGKTCNCGHTEIVIYRPCGHTICSKPCFGQIMKNKGIKLKPKTYNINGQEYITPNSKNIDLDVNFKCHICNQLVTRTFQAENINLLEDNILMKLTEELADDIYIASI